MHDPRAVYMSHPQLAAHYNRLLKALADIETAYDPGTQAHEIASKALDHVDPCNRLATENAAHTYTVKSGDTLMTIAMRYGKGGDGYKEIFALNKSLFQKPPQRLFPGDVLAIPEHWPKALHNDVHESIVKGNFDE